MTKVSRKQVLLGMAAMLCGVGTLYGCSNFLTDAAKPQGTLDATTLANKAGVEGTLIAAYRQLDRGVFGAAANNWVFGSVTSDDAYKGSEASDAPSLDPIEQYQWSAAGVEGQLNEKWSADYEGVRCRHSPSGNEITALVRQYQCRDGCRPERSEGPASARCEGPAFKPCRSFTAG